MSRKSVTVSVGPSKPRNRVIRALIGRLTIRNVGRHQLTHFKRGQSKDRVDLDQRVRESGEW